MNTLNQIFNRFFDAPSDRTGNEPETPIEPEQVEPGQPEANEPESNKPDETNEPDATDDKQQEPEVIEPEADEPEVDEADETEEPETNYQKVIETKDEEIAALKKQLDEKQSELDAKSYGVKDDSLKDFLALAKNYTDEKTSLKLAMKKVAEKYPQFVQTVEAPQWTEKGGQVNSKKELSFGDYLNS